jgi:hypothetical protein
MKFALVICLIIVGFGAVFYLIHLATSAAAPTPISSIDSWMDYSYVWIEGVVSAGPSYGKGVVSFDVYDGSEGSFGTVEEGTIPVEYYDPAENTVPAVGDHVLAFGQLRAPVGADKELRISFPSDLHVTKAQQVEFTTISDILSTWGTANSLQFKRVSVDGTVTGIRPLSSAKVYTISENGDELQLYVHNGIEEYAEKRPIGLKVLDKVRVTAGLSQYSGTPQLALADYDELEIIGSENVQEVPIQSLNSDLVGSMVKVSGKIVFVEAKGSGSDLEISERVLLLDNVYNPNVIASEGILELLSDNDRALVKRGTTIGLIGKVQSYGSSVRVEWLGPQVPTLTSGSYEPPSVENFLTFEFNWNEIPGNDNGRLIEFLEQRFGTSWETAEIAKIDNDKTIKVYFENENYYISLTLNDENTEAVLVLTVDNVGSLQLTDEFIVKTEAGELNVYFPTIATDNLNDVVTVVGSVSGVSEIQVGWLPSHRLLTLQDNLGESIQVYIPNFLYERMQSPPSSGQTIKVVGKVTSVSGHPLVVQPGVIEDVQRVS